MKRIRIFLMLSCLLAMDVVTAAPITEHQAREIASRFLVEHSQSLKLSSGLPTIGLTPITRQSAFYIFNSAVADKGFVIVSSDDRLPAVLAYSDSGNFDVDDVPPGMQEWLDGYAAQVEAISAGAAPETRTANRTAIKPMLPVHWGQGMPYNMLLPHVEGSTKDHAYTGCVTTAMAHIMAYWQYPHRTTITIPGYTSVDGTAQIEMPPLEPMDFEWGNMHSFYYVNDSTNSAGMAVANLMLYCASSLRSNYGLTSTNSTVYDIPSVLMNYFGYKNTARYINRSDFSTESWEDAIYAELWAGCPVAYSGHKQSAGHAFVCDGCDAEGRFHINWGWEGKSNGYFFLNLLNPDDESIGSVAGNYSYIKGQIAAIGLLPGIFDSQLQAELSFEQLIIHSRTQTRSGNGDFSITLTGQFVNNTNITSQFILGWGLYNQKGDMVKVLSKSVPTDTLGFRMAASDYRRTLKFGSGITRGTYRILPIYSLYPGEEKYQPCIGSDVTFIEVTINNNSCTYKECGTSNSSAKYTVNRCTFSGTNNHGKPLTIKLNVTNTGTTTNDLIYMFVDGAFTAMGLANIDIGQNGDIVFRYTPSTAGDKTLSFSLNQSGDPVLYSQNVTINTMPSAKLDVTYRILNITDEAGRVITADRYSIIADVTNSGTEPYDEDFAVRLFRVTNDVTNAATEVQSLMQPLYLPVGESKSLQFDFDHDLVNGCKYSSQFCYYSNGSAVSAGGTKWYYLNLTDDAMLSTCYRVFTNAEPTQGGSIKLSGHILVGNKVETGDTVTVTFLPNIGWLYNGITVTDTIGNPVEDIESGDDTYAFVMPDCDVNVTVNFKSMPRVTTHVEPSGGGNVHLSGSFVDDGKIMAGETVTVTPIPNSGWACSEVIVTDDIGNPVDVCELEDGTYTFVVPDSDVNVTVYFETMYRVFTHVEPSDGGNVKLSARFFEDNQFKVGGTVTIIPIPNVGWQCSGVAVVDTLGNSVDIIKQGDGTYTLVMPRSDINVTVNYERSIGNLFEIVQGLSDINTGVTYILINRNNDKVMKRWNEADTTFQSQDIVEWLDDSKNIVRVDDDACFLTMSQLSDTVTTNSSQVYKAAYLTTGYGYLSFGNNGTNVFLSNHIITQSRIWMRFYSMSSNPIPIPLIFFSAFKPQNGQYGQYGLNYDNVNDDFKLMHITMSASNPQFVYFYKLVEAYRLSTEYDSEQGLVSITGGMVNGTAQRGETVTFVVLPTEAYQTATVLVTTANGEVITANLDEATGSYSFVMPAGDVNISAAFAESSASDFILGDVNHDGTVDIVDVTTLIDYLLGIDVDIDSIAADLSDDKIINIVDVSMLIDLILKEGSINRF